MNKDNKLKLKQGTWGRIVEFKNGTIVFIPTKKLIANARILDIGDIAGDGNTFTAHWDSNYNLNGDFRTELMRFDVNTLVMDTDDLLRRNKIRKENGLVEIK